MNKEKILLTKEIVDITVNNDTELNYLWIGKDNQNFKGKLNIYHNKPNLKSRIGIKVVLYDNSSFDLNGLVHISKGAIKSDTYLKAEVLILSEDANARIVPSLEILENDVKAGHSAVVRDVDKNEIYYLSSRGISEEEAKEMIVNAFLNS